MKFFGHRRSTGRALLFLALNTQLGRAGARPCNGAATFYRGASSKTDGRTRMIRGTDHDPALFCYSEDSPVDIQPQRRRTKPHLANSNNQRQFRHERYQQPWEEIRSPALAESFRRSDTPAKVSVVKGKGHRHRGGPKHHRRRLTKNGRSAF